MRANYHSKIQMITFNQDLNEAMYLIRIFILRFSVSYFFQVKIQKVIELSILMTKR